MPGYKVNMDDVGGGFEALPGGTYIVEIVGGEPRQAGESAKNPDAWYGALEMDVKSPVEHEGRKLFTNFNVVPTSLFTLAQLAAACDFSTDEISEELGDDFPDQPDLLPWQTDAARAFVEAIIGTCKGHLVKVRNQPKEYQGEMRNNVKKISPVSEEDQESLSLLPD
jgi:hypothetical protein